MPPYWSMAHGTNSKDFRTMTIALNLLDAAGVALNQGMLVNLDMASLLAGAPVATTIGPAVQGPAKTIFYRQEWTPDASTLVQGGKAAFYRFDANLTEQCRGLLPLENGKQTETHDLTLVPNSDYAVMQMRRWVDFGLSVPVLDGQLQLVKVSTCQTVGKPRLDVRRVPQQERDDQGEPGSRRPVHLLRSRLDLVTTEAAPGGANGRTPRVA